MIDWPKLAENVRVERAKRHIQQKDAAVEIGIDPANLSRLENGKTLSADGFMAVCKWLQVPAEETLT